MEQEFQPLKELKLHVYVLNNNALVFWVAAWFLTDTIPNL